MSDSLSEELVVEILVKLPLKDLARFRCVCKTWRDLINHLGFAERYREISPVKFVSFYDKGFYLLDVEGNNPVNTNHQKLDFPLDQSMMIEESTCVLHCDGMLCVTLKNHILMIWNPFSKQFKIVPNPGVYRDSNILGFGYDPVYDDYKIVTFIDRFDSSMAQVFEFRTGSWRESIQISYPDWYYRERKGTFLDQYIYWIAYRSNTVRFILSFDLSTNEYRKFPLPVYNEGVTCSWLGVTSKKLCITEYEPCEKEIWISVLEKTGVWNKLISLSMSKFISVQNHICDFQVDYMLLTKNNGIVVIFNGYYGNSEEMLMFLYKTRDKTFQEFRFYNSLTGFRFLSEYAETPVIMNRIFEFD